jgi:presenilin-like A22 family membrane protease
MAEMLSWFGTGFRLSLGGLAATIVGLVVLGVYDAVSGFATRTRIACLYRKDERGTL